ncbi:MAG TPA: hypothetical protein VHI54_02485 [Actinomycetota bacterium]|nr:hypothetical protein [Actinomycetota bacterium]
MTNGVSGRDVERVLTEVGSVLDWPTEVDLAVAVGNRLKAEAQPAGLRSRIGGVWRDAFRPIRSERSRWQLAAAAAVAALVLFSAVLALSSGARTAVAEWFGLRGVEIRETPASPRAPIRTVGEGLDLGRPVAIQVAEGIAGFRLQVPRMLGRPDLVFVRPLSLAGNEVFLVYESRPGLPESSESGVGVLLSEFRGELETASIRKVAEFTQVSFVRVNGNPGFWIEGPHQVVYLDPDRRAVEPTRRLAGSVLLWEQDGITFRLESALSLKRALEIARSVE